MDVTKNTVVNFVFDFFFLYMYLYANDLDEEIGQRKGNIDS